jgi:hypothetical protein
VSTREQREEIRAWAEKSQPGAEYVLQLLAEVEDLEAELTAANNEVRSLNRGLLDTRNKLGHVMGSR